jgi:hypothetical protein
MFGVVSGDGKTYRCSGIVSSLSNRCFLLRLWQNNNLDVLTASYSELDRLIDSRTSFWN